MPTLQTGYENQMVFGIRILDESTLQTVKCCTDVSDIPYHQQLMNILTDSGAEDKAQADTELL